VIGGRVRPLNRRHLVEIVVDRAVKGSRSPVTCGSTLRTVRRHRTRPGCRRMSGGNRMYDPYDPYDFECEVDPDDYVTDFWIDGNGVPTECRMVGGQPLIVHYDDLPDKDKTVLRGIPVTTALRTVIDVAGEMPPSKVKAMVRNALARRLFTREEAYARIAEPDLAARRGAIVVGEVLDSLRGS
jgi:hypothetical protein